MISSRGLAPPKIFEFGLATWFSGSETVRGFSCSRGRCARSSIRHKATHRISIIQSEKVYAFQILECKICKPTHLQVNGPERLAVELVLPAEKSWLTHWSWVSPQHRASKVPMAPQPRAFLCSIWTWDWTGFTDLLYDGGWKCLTVSYFILGFHNYRRTPHTHPTSFTALRLQVQAGSEGPNDLTHDSPPPGPPLHPGYILKFCPESWWKELVTSAVLSDNRSNFLPVTQTTPRQGAQAPAAVWRMDDWPTIGLCHFCSCDWNLCCIKSTFS